MGQMNPRPGEQFRHFKNKLYQVIAVASHSETGEQMVVYQALYPDFKVYVRPFELFTSEVDRIKYPGVKQKYRFECLSAADSDKVAFKHQEAVSPELQKRQAESPKTDGLMEFLDARTHQERLHVLDKIKNTVNGQMLDTMADVMDIALNSKDLESKFFELRDCIRTYEKYEKSR